MQSDNARPHTGSKTVEHVANLGYTVLPYPLYSLDLAPSDFHQFGLMKRGLCRQHFPSNNAIMVAMKQWVISAGANFYEHSMQALIHGWQKCRANDGHYRKEWCFVAENFLYKIVLLFSL